jgi:hypothetical protein
MEGRLRRVGERMWEGELHGYRVYLAERSDQWVRVALTRRRMDGEMSTGSIVRTRGVAGKGVD